jgi:mannitol/fructose-specific phosphotransferase system IIA component (Ntr-type)
MHLHILARLAVMAHSTDFLERLDEAESADEVIAAIRNAEEGLVG